MHAAAASYGTLGQLKAHAQDVGRCALFYNILQCRLINSLILPAVPLAASWPKASECARGRSVRLASSPARSPTCVRQDEGKALGGLVCYPAGAAEGDAVEQQHGRAVLVGGVEGDGVEGRAAGVRDPEVDQLEAVQRRDYVLLQRIALGNDQV